MPVGSYAGHGASLSKLKTVFALTSYSWQSKDAQAKRQGEKRNRIQQEFKLNFSQYPGDGAFAFLLEAITHSKCTTSLMICFKGNESQAPYPRWDKKFKSC